MPTDNGDIEKVTAEKITGAMGDEREKVCCFLKQVQMAGNEEAQSKVVFSKEETQALDSFAEKLHCTVSMQHRLRQAAQYRKLTGENLLDGIQKIEEKNPGPYKGKREGNTVLEQFVRV